MIDENMINLATIADTIIYVQRNNVLPPGGAPAGVTLNAATRALTIDYGFNGTRYGSIEIARGQFQMSRVTNAAGALTALAAYNHAGKSTTKQDYINALKCNDLNSNQTYASALIILTSESCRSAMVSEAIQALMNDHGNFSDDVWAGLSFAFTSYAHTAGFKGYNINAGGSPWTWLRAGDYIDYINSPTYGGNKTVANKIMAVNAYNNSAG